MRNRIWLIGRGKQSTWNTLLLRASVFCYVGNGEEGAEESILTTAYRSAAVNTATNRAAMQGAGTARCDSVVQSSTGTQAAMRTGKQEFSNKDSPATSCGSADAFEEKT